jgi:hypothetical protein
MRHIGRVQVAVLAPKELTENLILCAMSAFLRTVEADQRLTNHAAQANENSRRRTLPTPRQSSGFFRCSGEGVPLITVWLEVGIFRSRTHSPNGWQSRVFLNFVFLVFIFGSVALWVF